MGTFIFETCDNVVPLASQPKQVLTVQAGETVPPSFTHTHAVITMVGTKRQITAPGIHTEGAGSSTASGTEDINWGITPEGPS